jgi:hypothetical protein
MTKIVTKTDSEKVRYFYTYNPAGRRVTVAYVYLDSIQAIKLSTSECVPTDRFVKATGRNIAKSRLSQNYHTHIVPFGVIGGESYGAIAQYIASNIKALTKNN